MVSIPNLRHLRAFQAVARLGSVGQASLCIRVSQPAVTQAIAKLETQFGTPLFERSSSGSYLTETGAIVHRRVERCLTMIEESLLEACDTGPYPAGILNLVTSTQIRSLIATADAATVAVAALAMGVSETTLYRSARELEQVLGQRLFQTSANGLVSTPLGTELCRKVGLAVRELDYANEDIAAANGLAEVTLSIGVLPMSGSFALAAAINDLTSTYPNCKLKVVEGTYLKLLTCLRAGEVDLNFGLIRRPDWATDIVELPLFDDAFCVIVRCDHPLARITAPTRADLARYEWVVPSPGTPRRDVIDSYFAGMTDQMNFAVETSSISVIRALVANSDRVSVLSRHEVDFDERTRLFSVLPVRIGPRSVKGITMRANWLPTALHTKFVDLLRLHTASETDQGPGARTDAPQFA